jgi:hypothetical protein
MRRECRITAEQRSNARIHNSEFLFQITWAKDLLKCPIQHSATSDSSTTLVPSTQKDEADMSIERNHDAERLARIDALLVEAKRIAALTPPTDRLAAQRLCVQLDLMLNELRPPSVRRSPWAPLVTRSS